MTDSLGRHQKVLVLGGGSDIARATVRRLLRDGPLDVVLAVRDPARVDTGELEREGASVQVVKFDARAPESHREAIASAFDNGGDVDLALVAFGVLGRQEEAERDEAAAVEIVETNFTGAVSALTVVAERMRGQGHGTIVVLSSVAAERPRRSNYVYGASKAGLDAFARGLQLATAETGVHVLIVRPGFVRTKMTEGLRAAPFSVGPERVAEAIVAALRRADELIWVPPVVRPAMWLVRALPRRFLRAL